MNTNNMDSSLSFFKYAAGLMDPAEKKNYEKVLESNPDLKEKLLDLNQYDSQKNFQELAAKTVYKNRKNITKPAGFRSFSMISLFSKKRQPILAFAVSMFILVCAILIIENPQKKLIYASKGSDGLQLIINNEPLLKNQIKDVHHGDTIHIRHRNLSYPFLQIWYKDDQEPPLPYIAPSIKINPDNNWNWVPKSIVIQGHSWQFETIWVILSQNHLNKNEALNAIQNPHDKVLVQKYEIRNLDYKP